ncbi:putative AT hook domain-containing protein [Blumeria hordei DH14]|uniref:Putative AT hook domain-containing protein n=1 Tax=Blumeria graminis f. sp. hordei (strain DH14) TaxID=546991 RepID=N1J5Q5_BLUG1|nr:putative AT hook domain-containing protein [Blumeria hordei DH14]
MLMVLARDERIQQRLRGAQRREIGNVDFGLKIPITSEVQIPTVNQQSQVQSQLSSRLELEKPDYTHKTPETRSFPTNVKNGSKNSSNQALSTASSASANTSKKRRRLDKDSADSTSPLNTSFSPKKNKKDPTTFSDDELSTRVNISDISNVSNVSVEKDPPKVTEYSHLYAKQSPQRSGRKSQILDEVSESPVGAPGSGQRIRLEDRSPTISRRDEAQSVALSQPINNRLASRKKKRKRAIIDTENRERSPSLFVQDNRNKDSQVGDGNRGNLKDNDNNNNNDNENEDSELDELSPEISCRNRQNAVENILESDNSSMDEINLQEPDRSLNSNQGVINNQKQTRKPREYSPDLDMPQMAHNHEKRKKQDNPITTRTQQSGTFKTKLNSHPSKRAAPIKSRSRDSIPVTVHRLSAPKNNETDFISSKFLKEDMRCKTRISINFIDVLDQVSQKVVESKLSRLKEQCKRCNSEKSRKDYNIKVRAVEAYGQELQTRLIEYTCDLDNSYSLESRLRDEKKKRLYFREELLRTRAERDQIALRMDEVRINHENLRDEDMRKDALNNTLHNVELATDIARGNISKSTDKKPEIRSIEFLLKKLSQDVSTKSSSGGILRRVKEFNEFLERAAVSLEKRPI